MALKIINNKEVFEVSGHLNSKNVIALSRHMEYLLEYKDKVVLKFNNVKNIDRSSIKMLRKLHKKAKDMNKILHFMGQNNFLTSVDI